MIRNGTGPNIVTTKQGNLLVAKATDAFLHDLDGNLTSDSLWTNSWNGENRLIATESASDVPSAGKARETWSHLPDGRWIERVISTWNGSAYVAQSTNRFVWDGQVLLAIVNHTNGLVSSFARGLDLSGSIQGAGGVGGVLAVNIATNGVHFAAFDGNGNVSALVSVTNGAVTANYEYSPFGETLRANGVVAKANPLRFSTQFADEVTGDLKYLFRETRPSWGRWLSRDPIQEPGFLLLATNGTAGLPILANPYTFVRNSAVNDCDYLGLCEVNLYTRGCVSFRGLSASHLQDFRLIKEDGTTGGIPHSGIQCDVDGFWWKGSKTHWFKIPDHCWAIIKPVFSETGFSVETCCDPCDTLACKIVGRPVCSPQFVPDSGNTRINPSDYPF